MIILPAREVKRFRVLNSDKGTNRTISNYGEQYVNQKAAHMFQTTIEEMMMMIFRVDC